jgi:hypothetical protein
VRRRRLIFRSTVLVLALGAAVGCAIGATSGGHFGMGQAFLAMVFAVLTIVEALNLVAAVRDRSAPERPPGHAWWVCELPVDHPFVLTAQSSSDNPTWRCRRCGQVRHSRPPRSIADSLAGAETSWVEGHGDR